MRSYYVDLISRQGLIGIVLAQSPEFVAPHGAKQPIFGTNPIGISIPAGALCVRHTRGVRVRARATVPVGARGSPPPPHTHTGRLQL